MHSMKSLLSGFVDMQPAQVPLQLPDQATALSWAAAPAGMDGAAAAAAAGEGELPGLRAEIPDPTPVAPSRWVELPIAGQGTVGVEVAHFERPPPGYRIALVDSSSRLAFLITVRDLQVVIERIEDGRVTAQSTASAPSPMIGFGASSMAIWVSVDRNNRRVALGCGYMMRRNQLVELQLPSPDKAPAPPGSWNVRWVVFEEPLAFYADHPPRVNRMPVVIDAPPAVVDRDALTLDALAANERLPASMLPDEAQTLWGTVSGELIAVSQELAEAIDYSLETPGKTLFEIIKRKREKSEFGDPNMVYVRVTIGPAEGDSPGIPFVMEIWPKHCLSPVHNHGGTVAVIKVLHGSISVGWYGPLADKGNPVPVRLAEATFHAGEVTWLTPEMYQTHQLKNPRPDTACITIQSYRYLDRDDVHHEFFDYLAPSGGDRRFFEPDSDIDYLELVRRVREEHAARKR